jgi:hypothetical protein
LETRAEPDSESAPAAAALAASLRAHLAAAAGDSARALALLAPIEWARAGHAAAAEPLDRLLHADLLASAGRYADAARWYATLGDGAPQELPFVGFAALGLARANERLNDRAGAIREYRRVVQLWEGADPALQAMAGAAARRITALEAIPR